MRSPSTSSSSQTLRYLASVQDSFFQVHFASKKLNCSYSVGQMPKGNPPFCVIGISFSCTASLLQHNLHKDLESQFECHNCTNLYMFRKNEVHYLKNIGKYIGRHLPQICLC